MAYNTFETENMSANGGLGIQLAPILDVWSSSLPDGKYVIFDSELRCLYVYGPSFVSDLERKTLLGKKYEEFSNSFLSIDNDTFLQALNGNTVKLEKQFGDNIFQIIISPIHFPEHEEKFVFFSAIEITQDRQKENITSNLLDKQISFLKQEESLYREIISIFNWRQEIEGKGGNRIWMKQALPNLNTSLMQGSGIGALITTVGAVLEMAKRDGKNATVPLAFLDLLEENFLVTKRLIKTMAEAQVVFEENQISTEEVSIPEAIRLIESEVEYLADMLQIKKQKVITSTLKNADLQKIRIGKDAFKIVIREILINAMKYSPDAANILILFLRTDGNFIIKFINPPSYKEIENIDCKNSEEIALFQPFFRLKKAVDERYSKEEFGIGLGLPVVQKLVEDMQAKVYFTVTRSNIYENEEREVCASLQFSMI